MLIIDEFLKDLRDEAYYRFGSPWRYSEKTLGVIVPIIKQDDKYLGERVYLTLEEARDQGITIKDTGRIDRVILETRSKKYVFVRSGTVLKSTGTQSRAVETSVVITPQGQKEEEKILIDPIITKQEIPVRCIYSSKPISADTKFEYGGYVTSEVGSALMSRRGQHATWDAINYSTHRLMSSRRFEHAFAASSQLKSITRGTERSIGTGSFAAVNDLAGVIENVDKFTEDINKILAKVPIFENQVGAVFLDMKDVVGLELFDHPKSWEAIHKEVEKRLGESLTKEEEKTFFKPDYEGIKPLTLGFLKKLLESEKIETPHGVTSTIILRGDGVIGEATTIDGKVIHLIGMKDDNKGKEYKRDTPIQHFQETIRASSSMLNVQPQMSIHIIQNEI